MKLISTFLICTVSLVCYAQNDNSNPYHFFEISISKWTKDKQGNNSYELIVIDADGNVLYNDTENYSVIKMASITEGFKKLIFEEKPDKNPGTNYPSSVALVPENEKQVITVTLVEMEDYMKDKNLIQKSNYKIFRQTDISDVDLFFMKYLSAEDAAFFKKLLVY